MSDSAPPSESGGVSPVKLGFGVTILVLLNYLFNEVMDDSGLHIALLTAHLPVGTNATERASFRALAEHAGMTRSDPSEANALRFELMEGRDASDDAPFVAALITRRPLEPAALPSWLAAGLAPIESTRRLTTLFPERARWREAAPTLEPGELGELGRASLLVQQTTWTLTSYEASDAFRRSWPELGYNALGEPGVVRCDLLLGDVSDDGQRTTLVSRKVFRHAAALAAHEATPHYTKWKTDLAAEAAGAVAEGATELFDTLLPRSSFFPFRSRWAVA